MMFDHMVPLHAHLVKTSIYDSLGTFYQRYPRISSLTRRDIILMVILQIK
jgi:hypothetical protein